ncbi:catalytic phage domain protein : Uncharacterized protein OS=Rhodopirellula maiorica SM1 GN=RMSM_00903 PE=4 SV=1: Phage_integrase [Gemmata massiliana]|uniref:Tyr recombinase domain-containing protein n=1 Tax=Gemmata massiliana TaxID=1210884 RepID=A0A6P2CPR3_9BACT|nr:site-specific integrase [Gemmata massiliana]VTR90819.1 catalytic phage domain protein : Uncharacterized protein OS=Rhodopirellula maiorica SM1 GN=RMSM_00903 PE=4 SV=1: Phage_integrase [Gemmata massiliana]
MPTGTNTFVELRGERITLAELAKRTGINVATLRARIFIYGKTVEDAAAAPLRRKCSNGGRPTANVPRPVPNLKRHPSARAYSRWRLNGKVFERYFGKYGSPEANAAYRRFAADWLAGKYDVSPEMGMKNGGGLSVAYLAERWMAYVRDYYQKNGNPTSEVKTCLSAARLLNDERGAMLAADFAPADLRACREVLIGRGHSRTTVNAYVNRVVRMFAWGAGQSFVPANVHGALKLVEKLKPGRSVAPDLPRKRPATDSQIEATLPHLAPNDPKQQVVLTTMIRLQRLTGMRPGELCAMEAGDLERTADVWIYRVGKANKNLHRGKLQTYYLGPRAVALLTPYLAGATAGPLFPFDPNAYAQAVARASIKAGCKWTPHQLRHALATEVAEKFRSLDYAAAAIGDTKAVAEAVYVHIDPDEKAKIEIAKRMG